MGENGDQWIACDDCEEWYHFICERIVTPPDDDKDWFCRKCLVKHEKMKKSSMKKQTSVAGKKAGKKKK